MAEMFKDAGYSTAHIGKWHLGRPPELLATSQGFDYYFGLPVTSGAVGWRVTREPVLPSRSPAVVHSDRLIASSANHSVSADAGIGTDASGRQFDHLIRTLSERTKRRDPETDLDAFFEELGAD